MFVRKKRNKSGSVSIQIIDKEKGYRVVQTVGSSKEPQDIENLFQQGKRILNSNPPGQQWLLSVKSPEETAVEKFAASLSNAQIRTVGPELIFGTLFDRIGFNAISDELFRHITIARLAYPVSKLKTIDYLYRYQGKNLSVYSIYRFMDRLNSRYKEEIEAIAYSYTKERLSTISVVFYDMTTLYFETEDEDDLRRIGYSKDGKFQNPQILLGLLVGEEGMPLGYDIFEGNTFEGHTLLPILKKMRDKYGLSKPVVVADAALLSKQNLESLEKEKYQFILGGRLKNECDDVKAKILDRAKNLQDNEGFILKKYDGTRLVVTFSAKRAGKDAANRRKGVLKLRRQVSSGLLTKQSIHNRGYNRFLTIKGEASVIIDEEKIKADEKWDGLKGYITNTNFTVKQVVENYVHLWHIERAFRISKTDLRIRPVFHQLRQRIEAHICISFVAYTICKEAEYILRRKNLDISSKRATELTHNMYRLEYVLPGTGEKKQQLLRMDKEQQLLYDAIHS